MNDRKVTVTKLELSPEGWWTARVTGSDGVTVDVDRRYGSWQATIRKTRGSRSFVRRDVLAYVAAELQARVRPLERKMAKEAAA